MRARRVEPRGRHGEQARVAQRAEQLELHRVHERAALERVELLDRLGLLARRELPDRLQEEAVRAQRIMLERGRGVAARGERVRRERAPARVDRLHEPVRGCPARDVPAPRAEAQRAPEVGFAPSR